MREKRYKVGEKTRGYERRGRKGKSKVRKGERSIERREEMMERGVKESRRQERKIKEM